MDKGEFIKGGYSVFEADGGSWVVHRQTPTPTSEYSQRAFTSFVELTRWLTEEHAVLANPMHEAKERINPDELYQKVRAETTTGY